MNQIECYNFSCVSRYQEGCDLNPNKFLGMNDQTQIKEKLS